MNIFDGWSGVIQIVSTGILSYLGLIILLRISGKRTLSQMNSYDFIITIAMGSTLSSGMLQPSISLVECVMALGLLILLQLLITKGTVYSNKIDNLAKSTPAILFLNGDFKRATMSEERVVEDEIFASIRARGISNLSEVEAVVLETNGKISCIKKSREAENTGNTKTYKNL